MEEYEEWTVECRESLAAHCGGHVCELVGLAYKMRGGHQGLDVMKPDGTVCNSQNASQEQPNNSFVVSSLGILARSNDHPHSNGGLALGSPSLKIQSPCQPCLGVTFTLMSLFGGMIAAKTTNSLSGISHFPLSGAMS